jgi:hypothetical protein
MPNLDGAFCGLGGAIDYLKVWHSRPASARTIEWYARPAGNLLQYTCELRLARDIRSNHMIGARVP